MPLHDSSSNGSLSHPPRGILAPCGNTAIPPSPLPLPTPSKLPAPLYVSMRDGPSFRDGSCTTFAVCLAALGLAVLASASNSNVRSSVPLDSLTHGNFRSIACSIFQWVRFSHRCHPRRACRYRCSRHGRCARSRGCRRICQRIDQSRGCIYILSGHFFRHRVYPECQVLRTHVYAAHAVSPVVIPRHLPQIRCTIRSRVWSAATRLPRWCIE